MAHRKDRKEALRQERERREAEARAAAQRKRLVGFGAAAVLAIAAAVVVVLLVAGGGDGESGASGGGDVFPEGGSVPQQQEFDLATAARNAECELTDTRATSREHTTNPDQRVRYGDNPPTSGRHYEFPAEDGLYQDVPSDTTLVHALEHGRVIIWVKPSLPREDREQLRALFDEDTYQMLMVPRSNMRYAVAATAWNRDPTPNGTGRTLGCPRFNENVIDALRTFRDEHRSNGPEPVP